MADPSLVLGIDGGGSKTLLAIARPDGTLADWRGTGGTNPLGQPAWRERLAALTADLPPVTAAVAGLAGYGESPDLSAAQDAAMAALLPCPHSLHNDVQVAFDGAFQSRPGVLILAGTGSMAWAQDDAGGQVRVGGWGHGLGDEGSGFWIGQRALSLTTQVLDGRRPDSGFAEAILTELGVAPGALLDWHRTRDDPRFDTAALARCVARMAARGEALAVALMREAAEHLIQHVETARRRIGRPASPWSHAGGLFASAMVLTAMTDRLGAPVAPALPPIGGALWRAARRAGWPADAGWMARLSHSLADPKVPA